MSERLKGPPAVGYHTGEPTEPPRTPVNQAGIGNSHRPSRVIRLEVSAARRGTDSPKDAEEVLTVRQWLRKQVRRFRSLS